MNNFTRSYTYFLARKVLKKVPLCVILNNRMIQENKSAPSTKRVLNVAFFVNILDIVTNLAVVLITGSAVIFSEMLQGMADFTATGFLLIGLKSSRRPAGFDHPFGRGKEIFFWSLLATILMVGFTSTLSIYRGVNQLIRPSDIHNIYLGIIVTAIGLLTNTYALSMSYKKIVRKEIGFLKAYRISTRSAVKTAFVSDLIGALAAFIGLVALVLFWLTGNVAFDGIGAIAIGVSLAVLSLLLLIEIKGYLVGRGAPEEVRNKITEVVESTKGVVDLVELRTMYIGTNQLLINIEVNMQDDLVTDEIEKVIDEIRAKIQAEIPETSHIQIEAESPAVAVEMHEDIKIKPKEGKNAAS